MKNLEKLTNIIESIIFVSGQPVAISDIAEKLEVSVKSVEDSIKKLQEKYDKECGIQLLTFNKKAQFSSNPVYAEEVSSVLNPIKERELSKSMLEVAAIIAYKQPVTRIDLEDIRGNSEYAIQKLLELGVIEPVGRKDAVGRPVLFGTTDKFLKRFQISSLDELPDYDTLIEKINLLHAGEDDSDYLYHKDEYVEESAEVAAAADIVEDTNHSKADDNANNLDADNTEKRDKNDNAAAKNSSESDNDDDFELPDISEEEIPDFLKGEEVEKF